MEAKQAQLVDLLEQKKQFVIPIYQRTYSWKLKQCEQLLDDIIRVGSCDSELLHFIGSVVYFKPGNSPVTSVPELLVIDGQQRLTTVSILLLALVHFLKENEDVSLEDESWEEIQDTYLFNKYRKDESKYKLMLTRNDKKTFLNLLEEVDVGNDFSKNVQENYIFFKKQLSKEKVHSIYHGIRKLIIVDVSLEVGKDDPQLIFESLNSTGLDLSQADLIRNYLLMGLSVDLQRQLYEKYWYPMEQSFGDNIGGLALFIRDYLTMKEGSIPNIEQVYERYKRFRNSKKTQFHKIEDVLSDLYLFSKYYVRMSLLQEEDRELLEKFKQISKLKSDVTYPFLMSVYLDYEEEVISKEEFIDILNLILSYVVRRVICGIPTNSLNKTFSTLSKKIKRESYKESLQAEFILMDSYKRFPTDSEFNNELMIKDIYNLKNRNYFLESLENWQRKEPVNVENYTIEHIMPQNPDLSSQWKEELGENWEIVRSKYLHTIGNLTFTGYNSELSDRPFLDKKTITGGFNQSPLFLNESVRQAEIWDEGAMSNRAVLLAQRACEIWKRPNLPDDVVQKYSNSQKKKTSMYDLSSYIHLNGHILDLYNELKHKILELDPSVKIEFKKLYIAFKADTNFVDVVPQKRKLRLSLNIPFEEIRDLRGICKDVSSLGRWGNGKVEISLDSTSDLNYAVDLIRLSLEKQKDTISV